MFKLFGKKKKEAEEADPNAPAEGSDSGEEKAEEKPSAPPADGGGGASVVKLSTDLDRVKASVESFGEVRKSLTERISHISEQVGELRAMILDRDRTIQQIELKSIKAADMVETVQPEKMMVEIQKINAKFEALKANLEGNEAIIDRVMEELKEARRKLEFFRGIEEIIKLSEETKKELLEIKKVEATININTDKVQTIYAEMNKKLQVVDTFNGHIQEVKINMDQSMKDIEVLKVKMNETAQKQDLEDFVKKVQKQVDLFKETAKASSISKDIAQLKTLLEGVK